MSAYENYQLTSSVQGLMEQNQALTAQVDALQRQLDAARQAGIAARVNAEIASAVEEQLVWPLSERDKQAFGASIAAQVASDPASLDKVLTGDIQSAIAPHVAREKEHFDNQLRDRFFGKHVGNGDLRDDWDEAAFQLACHVGKMTGKPGF